MNTQALTIGDALRSLSAYPIPEATLQMVASGQGLDLEEPFTERTADDAAYKLAMAQLLAWLSIAPNVSQGGQSYSLSEAQRKEMADRSRLLLRLHDPTQAAKEEEALGKTKVKFGYKGSRL